MIAFMIVMFLASIVLAAVSLGVIISVAERRKEGKDDAND